MEVYQKDGDWRKAADLLTPLIDEDPANVDFQRQQGYLYLRAGDAEKARAAFKHLVELDPRDTRAEFYLAESLNDLNQFEEADRVYHRLLEKTPDDPDLLASLGLSQIGERKWNEARQSFQLVLGNTQAPDNLTALARTQIAYISLQKGQFTEAVEYAKPAMVFRDKPNGQAINIAVDALKKEKKYADAVSLLSPLASKYPADPTISARYVEMLMRAGDREKAQQLATSQAKLGPKNSVAIAEAYAQNDQFPEAITLLKGALQANASDVDLQFELATAYERSGEGAGAEKMFLEILKAHPDHTATPRRRHAQSCRQSGAAKRGLRRLARLGLFPPGQARSRREVPHRRDASASQRRHRP